jgi:AmmeMemoRadiSam system protein A
MPGSSRTTSTTGAPASDRGRAEPRLAVAARVALLGVAADAASAAVRRLAPPALPATLPAVLDAPGGAFVTLHRGDALRGCVGRVLPEGTLAALVARVAAHAAVRDPRFPPLRTRELDHVEVEVSVLSSPRPIARDAIDPARDGVVVRGGGRQAVLLPQVASRYGWDRETLLRRVCEKAGLDPARLGDGDVALLAFRVASMAGALRDCVTRAP